MTNEFEDVDFNNDAEGDNQGDQGDASKGEQPKQPEETPEAKRARLQRQLEQHNKKYPVAVEEKKPESKSSDLDYGQKAFLIANGVKDADEINLVKDIMANTGKSLDDVLASKYFQSEIKELRDEKLATSAMPNGSGRSGQSAQDTVDYWIAKGELPPASERELRIKVVNARLKKETNTNIFTSNPVVR